MIKNQVLKCAITKAETWIQKNSPTILSCVASGGVILTTVLAVKATPKAMDIIKTVGANSKKEAFKVAWKCYIPTALAGASTISCIVGANVLNKHQQSALISAYALVQNSYSEYKKKLKELYGPEVHNKIVDSIVKEKCEDVKITAQGACYNCTLRFDDGSEPDIVRTFYDSYSERYFESTIAKVMEAEYHLNRNFAMAGAISLNNFYDFLGLAKTDVGDIVGWSAENSGIFWIDFDHRLVKLEDGMEVYTIDMVFEPTEDWADTI